jgi:hypothetical protein
LVAAGLASTNAFGAATIIAGAVALQATGLTPTNAFGNATTISSANLAATGLINTQSFGNANLTFGLNLNATGLPSDNKFGSVIVYQNLLIYKKAFEISGSKSGIDILTGIRQTYTLAGTAIKTINLTGIRE